MKIVNRRYRRNLLVFSGLLLADGLIFGATDAGKVTSFVLIIGFMLLVGTVYGLVYGILSFARLYGLPIRRKRRLAGFLTSLVGCLIALQSVGELNVRDVLVLLPLVSLGYLYSFYGTRVSDTAMD